MAHLTHSPATAAAAMRSIGQRRPLPSPGRGYLCSPCAVTWSGDESDCWNCGRPASCEYARHSTAAHILRATLTPRPRTGELGEKGASR